MKIINADALKEEIRKKLGVRSLDDLLPSEKAIVEVIDRMSYEPEGQPERHAGTGMLSIEEVRRDCAGDVYTREEFRQAVKNGGINCYDGIGVYHDGSEETDRNVFDTGGGFTNLPQYPYVCWYNN